MPRDTPTLASCCRDSGYQTWAIGKLHVFPPRDRIGFDDVLLVVMGEFGRTPKINANAGRDHWGPAFTVMVGGGGVQGGRVVGATDDRAERPATDPHGPENLAATMYHLLGINYNDEFHTPEGRPVKIVNNGKVIWDLL